MTFLNSLTGAPLALALSWTLVHSLWEGAIIAAMLSALLLPVRSSRVRYAAACVAMLILVGAFAFTLIRVIPDAAAVQALRVAVVSAEGLQLTADPQGTSSPAFSPIIPWLAPLWILGVFAFYLRHATGLVAVHRLRTRGVCNAPAPWQTELSRLKERLHISRTVLFLESCLAETPVVLGHFRPVILIPVGLLTGLPGNQIEAILLHELVHVRRHDYFVNVIQCLVEGLFFYHPAAWWISRVIRIERENCCDDAVVSVSCDVHEYASALAALEHNRRSVNGPALAATGGSLMTRVHRLLYSSRPIGFWNPILAGAILLGTFAATLAAWQTAPQSSSGSMPSPYSNWVNEDVVYIITDQERAAYQKTTSDAERNKFIEQFWVRHNPTPSVSPEVFKEIYYRRIAYVNERYSTSGTDGWRTDRGHMYIVYGPPDEVESHPSPSIGKLPFEVWLYKHLDGIGDRVTLTFIDRTGKGDYVLAPGNP